MTNLTIYNTNDDKNTFTTLATCLFSTSKMNIYLFLARLKSIFSKKNFPLQTAALLLFRFFTAAFTIFILSNPFYTLFIARLTICRRD